MKFLSLSIPFLLALQPTVGSDLKAYTSRNDAAAAVEESNEPGRWLAGLAEVLDEGDASSMWCHPQAKSAWKCVTEGVEVHTPPGFGPQSPIRSEAAERIRYLKSVYDEEDIPVVAVNYEDFGAGEATALAELVNSTDCVYANYITACDVGIGVAVVYNRPEQYNVPNVEAEKKMWADMVGGTKGDRRGLIQYTKHLTATGSCGSSSSNPCVRYGFPSQNGSHNAYCVSNCNKDGYQLEGTGSTMKFKYTGFTSSDEPGMRIRLNNNWDLSEYVLLIVTATRNDLHSIGVDGTLNIFYGTNPSEWVATWSSVYGRARVDYY